MTANAGEVHVGGDENVGELYSGDGYALCEDMKAS